MVKFLLQKAANVYNNMLVEILVEVQKIRERVENEPKYSIQIIKLLKELQNGEVGEVVEEVVLWV